MEDVTCNLFWRAWTISFKNLFKQIFVHIIENILSFYFKVATSIQYRGVGWSLGDLSFWRKRRVFLVFLFVNEDWVVSHWTHLKIAKIWRRKGNVFAWLEDCIHFQVRNLPLKVRIFQIGQSIPAEVQAFCAYTRKHFITHPSSP